MSFSIWLCCKHFQESINDRPLPSCNCLLPAVTPSGGFSETCSMNLLMSHHSVLICTTRFNPLTTLTSSPCWFTACYVDLEEEVVEEVEEASEAASEPEPEPDVEPEPEPEPVPEGMWHEGVGWGSQCNPQVIAKQAYQIRPRSPTVCYDCIPSGSTDVLVQAWLEI